MQTNILTLTISGMNTTPYSIFSLMLVIYSDIHELFCKPSDNLVKMQIATSCGSSWLLLDNLWTYSFEYALPLMNNVETGGYPLNITSKQYEQLLRVYEACISPSQFMPFLINNSNR